MEKIIYSIVTENKFMACSQLQNKLEFTQTVAKSGFSKQIGIFYNGN